MVYLKQNGSLKSGKGPNKTHPLCPSSITELDSQWNPQP